MIPVAKYLPLRRSQRRVLMHALCTLAMLVFLIALCGLALYVASWAAWEVFKALHA